MKAHCEYIRDIDRQLTSIVKSFAILGPLSWPKTVQREFLASVDSGKYKLPDKIEYAKNDFSEQIKALTDLCEKMGAAEHPALQFLKRNAESYILGYKMLMGAGTSAVTEISEQLYGHPHDVLTGYDRMTIDVARYFLDVSESYDMCSKEEVQVFCADEFKGIMEKRIADTFKNEKLSVIIDEGLVSRASAGASYVKVRTDARFSDGDVEQLWHHEVMTHMLTYINGASQTVLTSLRSSAPRVTATQEGLATFSEYINGALDLTRLKRIALRIIALDMAVGGANMVDLFNFFKGHKQNNDESYLSAMRILRGGHPKGGIIFFKDNVYLRGLVEVESFLKQAMHEGRLHDMDVLFTGKLTTDDVTALNKLSDEGWVEEPKYLPRWIRTPQILAANLAFNDLTGRFRMD